MNNFEWIKEYYNVPAQIGRDVIVGGKLGTIVEDMNTYIGVIFKVDQRDYAVPCHPTSEVVTWKHSIVLRQLKSLNQSSVIGIIYLQIVHLRFGNGLELKDKKPIKLATN